MADTKITALAAIATVDPAADVLPIVDISDTSMAASGTTKKVTSNQILGAGGTATLASATITGAATVGTTLGVTGVSTLASAVVTGDLTARTTGLIVNATGVGMGMTPTDNLNIGSTLYASVSTKIDSITQTSHIFKGTPDAVGYEYAKIVSGREASPSTYGSFLAFYTETKASGTTDTSVERARFNSTGNLAFVTGKGIDFSAVTGGTGTATGNVLNDYEEGTFTPTIVGATTAGVGVYSGQSGKYTKVGNLVTVQIYVNWSAHTGTGNMRVSNLPFTNNSNFWSASVGYLNNIALTAGSVMTAFVEASTSYIVLWQYPTGGGVATEVPIDAAGGIVLSASYTVA